MTRILHPDLPHFIAFGEALTDLVRTGPHEWRSSCGGSPWNVAVAMSTLGQLSAFGGAVSRDPFGADIWQRSQDHNLDMRFIQQLPRPPLLAIVHELDPPQYFFIGQDSADLHFRPEGLPMGWTRSLRWAHFGSLSLVREPLAGRLRALAQALKDEGRLISYDPNFRAPSMDSSYDDTLEQMCRLADVIKVSDEDLRGLFRVTDHRSGLAQIAAWNPNAWLLLTRGAEGATLFHGAEECSGKPPAVAVVDTIGAGDAALAGLLDSLMRQPAAPASQHLRCALAAGAAACTAAGFAPPSPAQVAALAEEVVI
ncbi:carbohydrate kinase family protein [Roseateles cellulosilyticus]|uniref:Carbohydrate kinase n=1 Tax=Pelomonas cellulosilytica TaxID=2906762 RepID=A0ABS8XUQ4_9BURK|nr:carbohydrate kinase [Pelomonas sp. P8]MCE4554458.1 carbohydrate kinase [Pelomonas sp. P8]